MLNVIICVSVVLRKNTLARIVKFTKMRELAAACFISQTPKLTFNGARFLFDGKRSCCDGTGSAGGASLFCSRDVIYYKHSDKNNDMLMMIWLLRILIYLRGYEQTDSDRSHCDRLYTSGRLIGRARHFYNSLRCRQSAGDVNNADISGRHHISEYMTHDMTV